MAQADVSAKRTLAAAAPVAVHQRVDFVDILRGFAVLGILIANMFSYSGQSYNPQDLVGFDRFLVAAIRFLVEAKFYSLFSLLFGWGMAVQMLRAEARGARFVPVYLRRVFILLVFGILHGFFIWTGDILATYALYGFLLLALRKTRPRVLLILVALALLLPIVLSLPGEGMDAFRGWYERATEFMRLRGYPESVYTTGTYEEITQARIHESLSRHSYFLFSFGNIFAMFLLGLWVGKRRVFHNVQQHLPLVRRVLLAGLVVGLLFNGIYIYTMLRPGWVPDEWYRLTTRAARTIGAPALMLFYVGCIVLLAQRKRWQERLAPLASVGRMALTNYLLHSVVSTLLFYGYGLGLYGEFGPLVAVGLSVAIYVGQIRLSVWWMDRFRYGPMEWVWRVLTYGRIRPGEAPTAEQAESRRASAHPIVAWLRAHGRLVTVWLVLILWATALGIWWARWEEPSSVAQPAPAATVRARATATARADLDSTAPAPGRTAAPQPVQREPGPAVQQGDLWSVAMSFDEELALDHIAELADPVYEGRRAGSEGGYAAGDYIARMFAEYGLLPAGDDGGFFQGFPLPYFVELDDRPSLTLLSADGETVDYVFRQDFTTLVGAYGGEGEGQGGLVWANYCTHDDFGDLDASGRVVLCRTGGDEDYLRNGIEHGVAGLLLWRGPEGYPLDRLGRYGESWVPARFPSFVVSSAVVEDMLEPTGLNLSDLSIAFESMELPAQARLAAALNEREGTAGRNVLGVMPGRDPARRDDVVIVGAHYDHMGRDPDGQRCPPPGTADSCETEPGAVWPGANDDASGVAVMLEIARVWQEAGYVPERTVLFAAWDAEEQGLWGATHYVRKPTYPLTSTVAMLQLDMVAGQGDTLAIDGPGSLATRLCGLAESLAITRTIDDYGHSDHVPFRESRVPASALSWQGEDDPYYHRPADVLDTLHAEHLGVAGRLSNLALLSLASTEPAIESLVNVREATLLAGDKEGFLATSDPGQRVYDAYWWDDTRARGLRDASMAVSEIVAARDVVTATLTVRYTMPDNGGSQTLRGPVRFLRSQQGWRYGGPAMDELAAGGFVVSYGPGHENLARSVLQSAAAQPSPWSPGQDPVQLSLTSDSEKLRLAVSPALPRDTNAWVDSHGAWLVTSRDLTTTQMFTTTMTQLALSRMGMEESQAPWLWAGLPLVAEAAEDAVAFQRAHLPHLQRLLDDDMVVPIGESPLWRELESSGRDQWQAQAWAMTAYLVDAYGPDTGWRLAEALGEGLDLDGALQRQFSVSATQFDAAWQSAWRSRLAAAEAGLQDLLRTRQQAIVEGDLEGFLATVNFQDVTLLAEERHWFANLLEDPMRAVEMEGQLLALTEEGALALLRLRFDPPQAAEQRANFEVVLQQRDDTWLYGGVPLETALGERLVLRYPSSLARQPQELRGYLEETFARVTEDLGVDPVDTLEVKIYDNPAAFRASIELGLSSDVASWNGPPGAIKLLTRGSQDVSHYQGQLAYALTVRLLSQQGLDVEWLQEGLAQIEQQRVTPPTGYTAARRIAQVQRAAEHGRLPSLADLPALKDVTEDQSDLVYGAVRDAVGFLITEWGQATLNELVQWLARGEGLDSALQTVLGVDLAAFEEAWHESAARGHVEPEWAERALAFDGDAALAHVRELASPAYDGREAGTLGGAAAAQYVADQFAALGLVPAGDEDSYLQSFPITRSQTTSAPLLDLRLPDGQPLDAVTFGRDFRQFVGNGAGGGQAKGQLVWVRDDEYTDMVLDGKIVLRRATENLSGEVQKASEHGADGLLLITDVGEQDLQRRVVLATSDVVTDSIPVLEITLASYERMIEQAGYTLADFGGSPPALPLRLEAELYVPLDPPRVAETANVLGLLPGNDPERADELVILGAHYDHVGRSPDGTLYAGANDDASGIGVLLEVARLWREEGYQPARSVLFAAWGGDEAGQLGSRHYADQPLFPMEDTAAVLHLDGVGSGRGFYLTVESDVTGDALLRSQIEIAADQVDGRIDHAGVIDVGDQTTFRMQGVPTVLLAWDGSDDDANNPSDTLDTIDPLKLEKTGRIVALALRLLAQ